jgi:hypothetical protein
VALVVRDFHVEMRGSQSISFLLLLRVGNVYGIVLDGFGENMKVGLFGAVGVLCPA